MFAAASVVAAPPSRPAGYVTDEAQLLDSATRLRLESLLGELKAKTSAEMAVVTVSSLDSRDIAEYASDLFQKWGIGEKGKDNGILFLIAPNERRGRIEVGYGLESQIPDGRAGRILDTSVLPYFRENRYAEGIFNGTLTVAQIIAQGAGVTLTERGDSGPAEGELRGQGRSPFVAGLLLLILIIVFIRHPWIFWLLMANRGHRGGGWSGGGFGGGGFGGGMSGGGGASRGW